MRNIEGQIGKRIFKNVLIFNWKLNQKGKKEEDYFNTAKKWLLADTKELLDLLLNFKKENIN